MEFKIGDVVSFYNDTTEYEITEMSESGDLLVFELQRSDGVVTHAAIKDQTVVRKKVAAAPKQKQVSTETKGA